MATRVDICICTFRRPHVARTLESLAALEAAPPFRVIVADNDETPAARDLVEATAKKCGLDVLYIHAPARNISIARNACLDAATAPLLAFIDDDEVVTPGWLAAMVRKIDETGADVVLGPVAAIYGPGCPAWIRTGDFHSLRPGDGGGEITSGASCNVLLRRDAPSVKGLRFRKELGRTGGEDTVFFSQAHRNGARIAAALDAVVTEDVPEGRATFAWLLKRRFRFGQTHGRLLLETPGPGGRVKGIAVAGAKAGFCLCAALCSAARFERVMFWTLRCALHAGVVFRLLGKRELECYG